MSAENVEIVRKTLDAFAADDLDALVAVLDPAIEIVEWPESPGRTTFHGHEGALAALRSWADAWAIVRNEMEEFIEEGDHVIACGRAHARGKGSDIEVEIPAFNVYTLRDGKVTRLQFFLSKEQALTAAGLAQESRA